MYLEKLAAYLTGFPGRTSTYNLMLHKPEVPDADAAWAAFRTAFDVSGSVAAGDRVRLAIDGLPETDGIVTAADLPSYAIARTGDGVHAFLHAFGTSRRNGLSGRGSPSSPRRSSLSSMRILVVGGSGYVAGLVLPMLAARHDVTIFDRKPPATAYPYVVGDATDERALTAALTGADAVMHCAMGRSVASDFDINVKSVYLTLAAARAAGVPHAVHISSLSVYADLTARQPDEQTPPDARDPYGLTKRFGEEVCRAASAEFSLSVNVLRLGWPTPDDVWPAWAPPQEEPRVWQTTDGTPIHGTAASDVARAVLAALDYRDGFQVFHICGTRVWTVDKARRLLGWQPAYAG